MKLLSHFTQNRILNYLFTFGSEFLILFIGIALFKLINIKFESAGFAQFAIGKRLFGFLIPLLFIGMGVSLPKFLSVSSDSKQLEIYYTSLLIVTGLTSILAFVYLLNQHYFSDVIFGENSHTIILGYLILYCYSLLIHACLYNFFRGKMDFIISGILQFTNMGLLPILVFFISPSIEYYFLILFFATFLVVFIVSIWKVPFIKLAKNTVYTEAKILLRYGIQRAPGDIVLGLFFAIPTLFISNTFGLISAGNIAFCLSLFNMIIAVMSPINIILLPRASQIIKDKNFEKLNDIGLKLFLLSILIGIIAFFCVYFFGTYVLDLFDINDPQRTNTYLIVIFTGVIGYSVFSVLRSIIDAYYVSARISVLIIGAFVLYLSNIYVLMFFKLLSINSILISFSVWINLLGIVCFYHLFLIRKNQNSK